ncbi:MAG: DMT family transporter [Bacteroidales bacterium]|nr:DMT family transporter [Bacteroidales bacterium]HNT41192.1 DMT family transporter [Tenuifilaceae bacterium]MBP8643260.1 DMT family transporter [Bacteroidales bacterium]NLI88579.1 DMT family transporter [Bacteroidales bacterium]HOA09083.1 DMT family transporter [Tenuifilaceae bacterium]
MDFISSHTGELAALLTAVFWTVTSLAFESASKTVGSLSVNFIRLVLAFIFLSLYSLFARGLLLPTDAGGHQWLWLSLSGLVGFVMGDLFLFQSYVLVGARISMLIMSLSPPIAAGIGWLSMGETLTLKQALGMLLIFIGIAMVVLRSEKTPNGSKIIGRKIKFGYSIPGLLLAFGGAVGQAGGLVLSKYGMAGYDVVASVQIRVITGIVGFAAVLLFMHKSGNLLVAVKNAGAMRRITVGSFFGPFLGVSFSLLAVRYTSTGVASALMSIVPVLIIAPSAVLLKEKITFREVAGAIVSVVGVVTFFL